MTSPTIAYPTASLNSTTNRLGRSVTSISTGRSTWSRQQPFEAINALNYSGHYDGDRLRDAAQSLSDYGITLVLFDETGPVAEVATTLDSTIYDAAYVALAQELDTTVYIADGTLLDNLTDDYSEFAAHIKTYPD